MVFDLCDWKNSGQPTDPNSPQMGLRKPGNILQAPQEKEI